MGCRQVSHNLFEPKNIHFIFMDWQLPFSAKLESTGYPDPDIPTIYWNDFLNGQKPNSCFVDLSDGQTKKDFIEELELTYKVIKIVSLDRIFKLEFLLQTSLVSNLLWFGKWRLKWWAFDVPSIWISLS